MAWISVHEQLKDHRKVRNLAKILNCTRHEALGILVTLWLWGINNTDKNGDLNGVNENDIADGIMYRAQSPDALVIALVESRWLDVVDGHYRLHDWDIWQEQWYKAVDQREANKIRMREARNADCATHSATHSAEHSSEHVQDSPSPNRHLTVTIPKSIKSTSISSKVFADEDIELILATELRDYILVNNPKAKPPDLQKWAKEFDLTLRVDKRSVEDVRRVMEFSQLDSFWRSNILSPKKFREQFDALWMKMPMRESPEVRNNTPEPEEIAWVNPEPVKEIPLNPEIWQEGLARIAAIVGRKRQEQNRKYRGLNHANDSG